MKLDSVFLVEVLERAAGLVAKGWTQKTQALNDLGIPCDPYAKNIKKWSLNGALEAALYQAYEARLLAALQDCFGKLTGFKDESGLTLEDHLQQYNDSHQRRYTVRNLVFEAIKHLGEKPQTPLVFPVELLQVAGHGVEIAISQGWCKGAKAKNADSQKVDPFSEFAESWSLLGAIEFGACAAIWEATQGMTKSDWLFIPSALQQLRREVLSTIRNHKVWNLCPYQLKIEIGVWHRDPERTQETVIQTLQQTAFNVCCQQQPTKSENVTTQADLRRGGV